MNQHQVLFSLPLVRKRYLLIASIRTQVVAAIFSLIIKSNAELSTVFKICACNPLKKPKIPSLSHIAHMTAKIVFLDFCWAFLVSSSSVSAAWITTLHLYREYKSQLVLYLKHLKLQFKVITVHLIAGYVRKVAILFERAPRTKAEKAERVTAVFSAPFLFLINSFCFSWSNTVYCNIYNSCLSAVDSLKQNVVTSKCRFWSNLHYSEPTRPGQVPGLQGSRSAKERCRGHQMHHSSCPRSMFPRVLSICQRHLSASLRRLYPGATR